MRPPVYGQTLRLVALPALTVALIASLVLPAAGSAGTSKGAYIKQMDTFVTALDNDMAPVLVTSLAAGRAAFPAAKAKLARAERALGAIIPPAAIAADQKTLVVDADAMVSALDAAIAGKLDGVTKAKNSALQATLTRDGDKLQVAALKIVDAGYPFGPEPTGAA
jgi:hypothetical protein